MASTETMLRDAKAFAAAYKPSEDDHPDLESRVVMYRRAVEGGNKRVVAVHARTLLRFVGNLGLEVPKAAQSGGSDGPTKAELVAEAEALGLATSGTKADLTERIAEHKAAGTS